ncbi:MAG: glycosyltransferase [Bacteroidales bacterium]|nr:glycosyltransferase [Bacteroidales bacterium]
MKVLFVCNNVYHKGNGQSVAVKATMSALREHGVDARLMAIANPDPNGPQPDFPLKHWKFPLLEPIIYANGLAYAKIDKKKIREAVEWADIVHLQEGLPLQGAVLNMARKMGKTLTATYHVFAQNFNANLGFSKNSIINWPMMYLWRRFVFDPCTDIQCPTPAVRDQLAKEGYKSRLHVISNGIAIPAEPIRATSVPADGTIDLLCVGRLSKEKSQDTLLNAMRYSRYADRIRLVFAGRGTKEKKYRKMADRLYREGILKTPATFGFYTQDELHELARQSYLYIHCAWVEVEGLSCLEAVREGAVPVIAEGDMIGTSVFALSPESRYPVYDSRALAERIDWWIEHPEERNRMAQCYADSARNYDINKSAEALVAMFRQALDSKA